MGWSCQKDNYNHAQNSLKKPYKDRQKAIVHYFFHVNSTAVTSPPLPLSNVDLESADCQETVCEPQTTTLRQQGRRVKLFAYKRKCLEG